MVVQKSKGRVCICLAGINQGHFKRRLGVAIVRREVNYLEEAKTVPIGRKHKLRRPSRVPRRLVKNDGLCREVNRGYRCFKTMLEQCSTA